MAWLTVVEIVNHPLLDHHRAQRLIFEGALVQRWLDDGADLQADVIPTVQALLKAKAKDDGALVSSWKYFDAAVRRNAGARKAAEAATSEPIVAKAGRVSNRSPAMKEADRALHRALLERGLSDEAAEFLGQMQRDVVGGMVGAAVRLKARRRAQEALQVIDVEVVENRLIEGARE